MSERSTSPNDRAEQKAILQDETVSSIQALERLLRSVVTAPTGLKEELHDILKSSLSTQNGMARLELPEYGIYPRWVNTLKARADEAVTGGFEVLDALRKQALAVLRGCDERRERPSRGTKHELQSQLAAANETVQQLNDEIALVSAKLKEYMSLATSYAAKAGDTEGFARRHMELTRKYRFVPTRD